MHKADVERSAEKLLAAANAAIGSTWVRRLKVCALAAQRIASLPEDASTLTLRDVRQQILPLSVSPGEPSAAETQCAFWALHLYAALDRASSADQEHNGADNAPDLSATRAQQISADLGSIRKGLAEMRAGVKSDKLKAAIDDADLASQWVQLACEGLPALRIVSRGLVLLLKTLKRLRELLPKPARDRVDAWIDKARHALGIVEVAEAEETVRRMILAGTKPPAALRRKVRHLTFADIQGARWIADGLETLDLVATCENLEGIWIAGTAVRDLGPLIRCPKLRDVDIEATDVEDVSILLSSHFPHMKEIFWGATPAFERQAEMRVGNQAHFFRAPYTGREVVRFTPDKKSRAQ